MIKRCTQTQGVVAIRQARYWHKISRAGRLFFEAEKELFTHFVTLSLLLLLVVSATLVDFKVQKKAHAQLRSVHAEMALSPRAPLKLPVAVEAPPVVKAVTRDPNLPPMLTNNTQGISPELLKRFDRYRTFIFQQYGAVLEIRSGYRSTAEQAYLFRTLPRGRANPPGVSLHERGEAIDYTNFSPTFNRHLGAFGLRLPYPGKEDWHIERAEY